MIYNKITFKNTWTTSINNQADVITSSSSLVQVLVKQLHLNMIWLLHVINSV